MNDDIRQNITNKIIESLSKGFRPWQAPWANGPRCTRPRNIITQRAYQGINPLVLNLAAAEKNYTSPYWGTYKQFAQLGGQVKKRPNNIAPGEWGTHIVFYKTLEVQDNKKLDRKGNPEKRTVFVLRSHSVFNLDQVDGDRLDRYRFAPNPESICQPFDALDWNRPEELIDSVGATIKYGGNDAYYRRPTPLGSWPNHKSGDYIQLPFRKQFPNQGEFFCTAFHELAHWAEVRLQWDSKNYALNELIAEITACYLAAETGVPNRNMDNHNRYLASWLEEMNNDSKWIFEASSQASKVTDFLMGTKDEKHDEIDLEEAEDSVSNCAA